MAKYVAIIDTDEYKNFKFFEDGCGEYLVARDKNAQSDEWIRLPVVKAKTNGDMIKAIFPNAEYKHIKTMSGIDGIEVNGINGLYDNFGQWYARVVFFYNDWWNAPYEGAEKK